MPAKSGSKPATQAQLKAVQSELKTNIKAVRIALSGKIDGVEQKLVVEIVKTNERMGKMEERLTSLIREESAKTVGRIDAFLGRLETYARESVTIPKTLDSHGEKLRDHERRLSIIESK